jgi:hypothetical protein
MVLSACEPFATPDASMTVDDAVRWRMQARGQTRGASMQMPEFWMPARVMRARLTPV